MSATVSNIGGRTQSASLATKIYEYAPNDQTIDHTFCLDDIGWSEYDYLLINLYTGSNENYSIKIFVDTYELNQKISSARQTLSLINSSYFNELLYYGYHFDKNGIDYGNGSDRLVMIIEQSTVRLRIYATSGHYTYKWNLDIWGLKV